MWPMCAGVFLFILYNTYLYIYIYVFGIVSTILDLCLHMYLHDPVCI